MKITQIDIYKCPIKLKEPFVISLGTHHYAENIVLVIQTSNGLKGFGECCPFKPINGESMDGAFMIGQLLAKALIDKNPLDIEDCSSLLDKVIYGNSSIKSAFDIALHDIAAQHARVPLYKFLCGENNKKIVSDYTVSIGNAGKMANDALKTKNNGFQIIKVKLGGSKEQDVERIQKIREAVGKDITLRIDANQGWKADEAVAILNALSTFDIEHCEEPIPRWDFMELPRIKKESKISIMADESCCDHHDAKRLIQLDACDQFNVKLGKSYGIFKAQKIIRLAEQANMKMQIGGFLESRIHFTAAAHLALSSNNIVHFDFDSPLFMEEDPVLGGITYNNKGEVLVPDTIGLGASMSEDYLSTLVKCTLGAN